MSKTKAKPAGTITIERIDHVTVDVTDLKKAQAFYAGLFGMTEIPRPKSFTFAGCWYRIGKVDLHLVVKPQPDPIVARHFCVWVSDVHGAAKLVEAAGFGVKWDDFKIPGIDRFFTADPDGNRLEVQGSEAKA